MGILKRVLVLFLLILFSIAWTTLILPILYWVLSGKDPLKFIDKIIKLEHP